MQEEEEERRLVCKFYVLKSFLIVTARCVCIGNISDQLCAPSGAACTRSRIREVKERNGNFLIIMMWCALITDITQSNSEGEVCVGRGRKKRTGMQEYCCVTMYVLPGVLWFN